MERNSEGNDYYLADILVGDVNHLLRNPVFNISLDDYDSCSIELHVERVLRRTRIFVWFLEKALRFLTGFKISITIGR